MITYKYKFIGKGSDREIEQCAICQSAAPLAEFEVHGPTGGVSTTKKLMCEVCSSTFISNTVMYDKVYTTEERTVAVMLGQVANLLLDKLTKRKEGL